jgi:hypothetical protein
MEEMDSTTRRVRKERLCMIDISPASYDVRIALALQE